MHKSLFTTVEEPQNTLDAILMALKSPLGIRTVWVIVEGEDDVMIYNKMFDKKISNVKHASIDDNGSGGYKNVEHIVSEVINQVKGAKIIGIRDKDYSLLLNHNFKFPKNIFLTDRRDMEMMVLESDTVSSKLRLWANPLYDKAFNTAKCVAVFLGYLRIYNHMHHLSCSFHQLKVSKIWNQNEHKINDNWKEYCLHFVSDEITEDDLMVFANKHQLLEFSFYDICRGHDFIKCLSLALIKQEYNKNEIFKMMISSYSVDHFRKTGLYSSIYKWQTSNNVSILL